MRAIETTDAHVESALRVKSQVNSMYLCIARSQAWEDDKHPPNPNPDTSRLTSPIGYKRVTTASMARPLQPGETTNYQTVTYAGMTWVLVPDNVAYTQKARWVYIDAVIQGDELPLGEFRQVGIFTGLQPSAGVTKPNLLPSDVREVGILQVFENREPFNRTLQQTFRERFIIER